MQVYQLYEQENINSAEELAGAFNSEEWLRIANYFLETSGRWSSEDPEDEHPMGSDRDEIRARMIAINRTVGANQPRRQTPNAWVMKASRFGMSDIGDRTPTWNEIYAHLAPHRTYRLPPGWSVPGIGDEASSETDLDEFPFETATWIDTNKESWSDFQELKDEYVRPWFREAIRRKEEEYPRTNNQGVNVFRAWLVSENSIDGHMMSVLLNSDRSPFARKIDQDNSISKREVDQRLYSWLVSANGNYLRWIRDR